MTAEFDPDSEALLFELGSRHAQRSRELAQEDAGGANAALAPLSEAESRALIAVTLALLRPERTLALPLGTPRLRRHALMGLALAAAAGVGLFVMPRQLPEYELSSPRPDATSRSVVAESSVAERDAKNVPRYEIGRELRFVLRPARGVEDPVHVSVFSTRGGLHALKSARVEQLAGGSVAVTLGSGDYAPEPGPDTLVFALAALEAPSAEEVARGGSSSRLQLFRLPLIWGAP